MEERGLKYYSKYFLVLLFLVTAYFSFKIVQPYILGFIGALILAYIFYPIKNKLEKYVPNKNLLSGLMLLIVLIVIVLPLIFVFNSLITQSMEFYNSLNIDQITNFISQYASGQFEVYIKQLIQNIFSFLLSSLPKFLLTLPQKVITFVLMLLVLFFSFRDGERLVLKFIDTVPIQKRYSKRLVENFKTTISAILHGLVVISFLQGVVATIGFYIFGVESPILWGILVALIAMLPIIGPATVWVPLVAIKLLTADYFNSIGLTIYCVIFLSIFLDTLLKPKLIGDKAKLHPVVIFIGVIGGLQLFGMLGVVLGPLILVSFMEFLRFYTSENEIKN